MGTEVYVKLLTKEEAFERPLGWPSLRSGILKASVQNASVVVRVLSSRQKYLCPYRKRISLRSNDTRSIKFANTKQAYFCKFYPTRNLRQILLR